MRRRPSFAGNRICSWLGGAWVSPTCSRAGVHRAGSLVRVSVQLVTARDGFLVWGDKYERQMKTGGDIAALQEEIALAVAGHLRVALSPADTSALARAYTGDLQ